MDGGGVGTTAVLDVMHPVGYHNQNVAYDDLIAEVTDLVRGGSGVGGSVDGGGGGDGDGDVGVRGRGQARPGPSGAEAEAGVRAREDIWMLMFKPFSLLKL